MLLVCVFTCWLPINSVGIPWSCCLLVFCFGIGVCYCAIVGFAWFGICVGFCGLFIGLCCFGDLGLVCLLVVGCVVVDGVFWFAGCSYVCGVLYCML